jgi:hypothetical protein
MNESALCGRIKQKASLMGSRPSLLNIYTFKEHAHPSSYTHIIIFQMSLTHWVKFYGINLPDFGEIIIIIIIMMMMIIIF